METPYLTFIILFWPIIAAIVLIIISILFLHKENIDGDAQLRFGFGGFNIPVPIKNLYLIRIIIWLLALNLLFIPGFYNYSEYFQKSFDIDAYFDDSGIERALAGYSAEEIKDLQIPKEWKDYKSKYFEKLNDVLLKTLKYKNFFDITGNCLTSKGELTISIKKIKGFQHYYISESYGFFKHCVEFTNEKIRKINTEFNLLDTGDKYIKLNFYDIFISHGKVIKPHYKQYIITGPSDDDKIYDHVIVSLTKIKIFPFLEISKSIYLYQDNEQKLYIPIGYSINRPK